MQRLEIARTITLCLTIFTALLFFGVWIGGSEHVVEAIIQTITNQ